MATYEIPLNAGAQQFFIQLANVQYSLTLTWCEPASSWVLAIASSDGTPILSSIPLVPGVDLLGQYPHLNFGGSLYVQKDGAANDAPLYSDLGSAAKLYFVVS